MSPENLSRRAILAGADLKVVGGKADSPPVTIRGGAWGFYRPGEQCVSGMGTTARLDLTKNLRAGNKPLCWT
jgi:hypothetical protein